MAVDITPPVDIPPPVFPQSNAGIPPQGGEYLLVVSQEGAPPINIRIQSRRRALSIYNYDIRSDDLSFEMNFYPNRIALYQINGTGFWDSNIFG